MGHNFTLCAKGTDGPCEKALALRDSFLVARFLLDISTASEVTQYLTLLHYNMKHVDF